MAFRASRQDPPIIPLTRGQYRVPGRQEQVSQGTFKVTTLGVAQPAETSGPSVEALYNLQGVL